MKATFSAFPKLTAGNDDDGAPILFSGVEVGAIVREVEWRDVGHVSVQYRGTVRGYRVVLWAVDDEPIFSKLSPRHARTSGSTMQQQRRAKTSTGSCARRDEGRGLHLTYRHLRPRLPECRLGPRTMPK
jgi:hypothetical protein